MVGMEKLSKAILDKVRVEAEDIIKNAEVKAWERVERAEKQQEVRLEEEKSKLLEEAREEAARILAQAFIKSRQEILTVKTGIINVIIDRAKEALSDFSSGEGTLLNLINQAISALDINKARIYVSPKSIATVQKLINEDNDLVSRIVEIEEYICLGGVIVEDMEGRVRIDNTYDTRLEALLPQILPEINRELFGIL
jgi:V/A-type H+-transporting ATPase subunit E